MSIYEGGYDGAREALEAAGFRPDTAEASSLRLMRNDPGLLWLGADLVKQKLDEIKS
jgi:hypothetical protein